MMKFTKTFPLIALVLTCLVATAAAQDEKTQTQLASKTAKFETVAKTDATVTPAIDAHELAKAQALVGKTGTFKGTVAALFSPRTGTVLILNFDAKYKSALTAVVKRTDFGKFPELAKLEGKQVLVTGPFTDFRGATQIELTSPDQIKIVE
jgi:DNA/RNA endonuclease YhcR with UshA esterase domain